MCSISGHSKLLVQVYGKTFSDSALHLCVCCGWGGGRGACECAHPHVFDYIYNCHVHSFLQSIPIKGVEEVATYFKVLLNCAKMRKSKLENVFQRNNIDYQ